MPDTLHISFNQEGGTILYYEYDFAKHKGQTPTKKEAFQEVTVEPELTSDTLFVENDNLLSYVQNHEALLQQFQSSKNSCDDGGICTITKAILYSPNGFSHRLAIKKELENKMETRNLRLCFATCCCAICFAACCCKCCKDFADAEEIDLNEESYCRILKERFPTTAEAAEGAATAHEFM